MEVDLIASPGRIGEAGTGLQAVVMTARERGECEDETAGEDAESGWVVVQSDVVCKEDMVCWSVGRTKERGEGDNLSREYDRHTTLALR